MRRSSTMGRVASNRGGKEIDWELRPGGMLVQKREHASEDGCHAIKLKVSHGTYQHEVSVPALSTFGDLKRALVQETGLQPHEQRLLFRGKEKDDNQYLHIMGVSDMSKIILLEDPASKERKLEELKMNHGSLQACEAVSLVRYEVDKLARKASVIEPTLSRGINVEKKELDSLTELLMLQLLKLDNIEAKGEAKIQRRNEVRRVLSLLETLDGLKARKSNLFGGCIETSYVSTEWEKFKSGVGSLSAPSPKAPSGVVTTDWEVFDES